METKNQESYGRRAFLRKGALVIGTTALGSWPEAFCEAAKPALRVGLFTDVHYADRPSAGSRYYRESIAKVRECVSQLNEIGVNLVVELGDLIDEAETAEGEIGHLRTIEQEFAKLDAPRHYVLGNHCVWTLTKEQFFANCSAREPHYSFDQGGFHFVILDACYRKDGVPYGNKNFEWTDTDIPPRELDWLKADLDKTAHRTIVFVHQRLDTQGQHAVKSAPLVRRVLEESGKVLAVFQGHHHINDHNLIGGIHYTTMAAVIEGTGLSNSAYSVLDLYNDGSMSVQGFRKQTHYDFKQV